MLTGLRAAARLCLRVYHRRVLGLARQPPRFVLVLAHMRSGSTLLAHLLMSHRAVLGGGERNRAHREIADLDSLALEIYRERRVLARRYPLILDQINHTRFTPEPALLSHPRVRVVFLIREPGPAIASMVHTFQPIYGDWPQTRAVAAYAERVQALTALARGMTRPFFATTYEALTERPEDVLSGLSAFLDLDPPLEPTYRPQPFTGRRGDPSPLIQTGRIVKDRNALAAPLSEPISAEIAAIHATCLATMVLNDRRRLITRHL